MRSLLQYVFVSKKAIQQNAAEIHRQTIEILGQILWVTVKLGNRVVCLLTNKQIFMLKNVVIAQLMTYGLLEQNGSKSMQIGDLKFQNYVFIVPTFHDQ